MKRICLPVFVSRAREFLICSSPSVYRFGRTQIVLCSRTYEVTSYDGFISYICSIRHRCMGVWVNVRKRAYLFVVPDAIAKKCILTAVKYETDAKHMCERNKRNFKSIGFFMNLFYKYFRSWDRWYKDALSKLLFYIISQKNLNVFSWKKFNENTNVSQIFKRVKLITQIQAQLVYISESELGYS